MVVVVSTKGWYCGSVCCVHFYGRSYAINLWDKPRNYGTSFYRSQRPWPEVAKLGRPALQSLLVIARASLCCDDHCPWCLMSFSRSPMQLFFRKLYIITFTRTLQHFLPLSPSRLGSTKLQKSLSSRVLKNKNVLLFVYILFYRLFSVRCNGATSSLRT